MRLIAGAVEGAVPCPVLDVLVGHLEDCALCRDEAEAQLTMKRALASYPQALVPDALIERLNARLDSEQARRAAAPAGRRSWTLFDDIIARVRSRFTNGDAATRLPEP